LREKKILLLITVAVFVLSTLLAFAGCGDSGEPATKEPIKIGVVLSASGPNEPLGQPERKAIELFVERINEEGGIDGHEVEVIIKDDESDANKALAATVELIEQDEVVALIGSSGTGPTLSMKQEATAQEIPQVCMAAGVEIMDGDITWIFRTPPTSAEAGENALMYIMVVLWLQRFAIL
jgi:branched-chain amino acid transport system substrate-binding protein